VHDVAGFETFGREETAAGAFDVGFLDLDVHFSFFWCCNGCFGLMELLKSYQSGDVLGVGVLQGLWLCDKFGFLSKSSLSQNTVVMAHHLSI
jgi:hypothetical protein